MSNVAQAKSSGSFKGFQDSFVPTFAFLPKSVSIAIPVPGQMYRSFWISTTEPSHACYLPHRRYLGAALLILFFSSTVQTSLFELR